jgi:hypothetical protein
LTHYQITKPLNQLPPQRIKTFKLTSTFEMDFIKQFQSICVGFKLHNHTGGTFQYNINEEAENIDLKSLEETAYNVEIEHLKVISPSDADLIVWLIPLSILKRFNAVEVG